MSDETTDENVKYTSIREGLGMREQNKLAYHLIEPEFITLLAEVCHIGAVKYAPFNVDKGMDMNDLMRGVMSHWTSIMGGEIFDKETGSHHAAHLAWNALVFAMQCARDHRIATHWQETILARRTGNLRLLSDSTNNMTASFGEVKETSTERAKSFKPGHIAPGSEV